MKLLSAVLIALLGLTLVAFAAQPTDRCIAYKFAVKGDTTFYQVECTGKAVPLNTVPHRIEKVDSLVGE